MEDIRDVLEMIKPTQNVIDNLKDGTYYTVMVKEIDIPKKFLRPKALLNLYFQRYSTVPPKFINKRNQQRFAVDDIEYVFKIK